MKENFTRPQLLLYAYNETDLMGSDSAQRQIDGDPIVAEEYNEMTEAMNSLNRFIAEPSEKSVQKILAFASK